jgi:hypothetical protein
MAASAIDSGNKVEYLLCGMCFSSKAELLNNPNVQITHTTATVHSMPHNVGFKDLKEASTTDSVTMGNDTNVGAKMIAKLPGVVCNKEGHELQDAVLDDITYLPGVKYNLFSLSKMTRCGGWNLSGDKDALWIQKDGQKFHLWH